MAARVSEEGSALISTCESANCMLTQSAPGIQQSSSSSRVRLTNTHRGKWPFRSIGSGKVFIILAWMFITNCSQHFCENTNFLSFYGKQRISPWLVHCNNILYSAAFAISCPTASLLAEVVVGRYKFISYCLKVQWLFSFAGTVISMWEYYVQISGTTSYFIGNYLLALPTSALQGAFIAVAVPLGLDQIHGASSTNISAFVVWCLWCVFCGYGTADILVPLLYNCSQLQESQVRMLITVLPFMLFSVGLILDFCFHHKLVKEPVTVNPVSHIFKVLKYAAKHKYPVQRSAFTYCENEQPTRLDYGKSKYGGPFTTEQVEDVKTFWRVLMVIFAISLLYAPINIFATSYTILESQFRSDSLSHCIQTVSNGAITPHSTLTYIIPLYELLIYPCLRNRGLKILQSAGTGGVALILLSIYGIITETVKQGMTSDTMDCMFTQNTTHTSTVIEEFCISIPFNFILGLSLILVDKSRIEFVCAQAPYNMNGLLVGLLLMFQSVTKALGALIYVVWNGNFFKVLQTNICGIWFYMTCLLMTILISLMLSLVVRWYKGRERDEITESRNMVEDVYYKYNELCHL